MTLHDPPHLQRLDALVGPLTAREAWTVAHTAMSARDRDARLTLIVSDESIDQDGRARAWELGYLLPNVHARAIVAVGPCDEPDDGEPALCLTEQLTPFPAPGSPPSLLDPAQQHALWRTELARVPVLATPFRDSPAAVRALITQGADFVAGDTHMRLEARALPGGQAVWEVRSYDTIYQTQMDED